MMEVTIRDAVIEDAPFIAWTVLTALDLDEDGIADVVSSCSSDRSLYSWRHARIASVDGHAVGCLISYEGAKYMDLRNHTWQSIWGGIDEQYLQTIEAEAGPGDFYLDSMAILPEYRGNGIGRLLLHDGIERGKRLHCSAITLIVSTEKPHLYNYYAGVGFREFGLLDFFGHKYHRMQYK
jgi:ribosomal protein S18 acetylase RimI-like enzyme